MSLYEENEDHSLNPNGTMEDGSNSKTVQLSRSSLCNSKPTLARLVGIRVSVSHDLAAISDRCAYAENTCP